ncbi:AAA domain-containing protein [Plantactinospora solaniradicis]|uniref:AAA domain-containing protein n=1 Tax=Plantactinospora solaniradicis TaxID=1723736 RepID=A0ABW1KA50_9ACTN
MGRHALLLGTATCLADRDLQPLPGVRQDVAQLKVVLGTDGDFDSIDAFIDLPATQLRQVVEDFYGTRRTDDLALFYYSGHGMLHDDRQSLFLAATDTVAGNLHATAFDVDGMLRHLLNHTKARQKVVLLDCCFSGAFTARHRFTGGVRQEPRRSRRERGTFMLTSSDHMKASKAQGPDRPSVFTEALLDGLRGAAQPTADDGWITTNDLSRYVLTEMARRQHNTPVESSEGVTEPIRLVAGPDVDAPADDGKYRAERQTGDDNAPFDADQWRRLLTYYADCMQRTAVLQFFIDPQKNHTYIAAPAGHEAIFRATAPVLLRDRGRRLAEQARVEDKKLQYGYPVVAVHQGRQRRVRLVPLLVCDLTVGDDGSLHPEPPRPSPALVDHAQLSLGEADQLAQEVARRFVPGDREALAATVNLLMTTFGLTPAGDLDSDHLVGVVRPAPIDRVQNAGLLFAADSTEAPERQLVDDLRDMARNPHQIARTALGVLTSLPDRTPPVDIVLAALSPVNETQEEIIRAAMSQPLTVAQGPPGTGKSQLVTALLATATATGQSVLIGSTNNRAVDEVVERITGLLGPGLLLRTGNKEYRQQEPKYLADVLQAYPPSADDRTMPDDRTPHHELRMIDDEARRLRAALDARRLLERDLVDLAAERVPPVPGGPALPHDDTALAKLVELTDRALGSRWFGWWYRRRLRSYGVADPDAIAALSERAVVELRWRNAQRQLDALPDDPDETWRRLRAQVGDERPARSDTLLRAQVAKRVAADAKLLQDRADEMAKPDGKSWAGLPELLRVLPGWAITAMSARRLPPRPAMYDLVIIDEAAQCTVPAILPMLYRAKRALIIGDPRQLTPIVQLPGDEDRAEQSRAGLGHGWLTARRLTYAGHSAYEAFATAAKDTYLLDEHYRCHPEIVATPNREVYQGRLTVLTDPSRLAAPADPAMRWADVAGRFSRGATGSGRNGAEIEAVVDEVRRLRATYPDASIGVVTPLAAHQRDLKRALQRAGLAENLLCATIHKFQGSERDIMVVSPVGAQGISEDTRGWLVQQTNLWNVAITRARSQLVVVGDRSWWSGQRGLLAAVAGNFTSTGNGSGTAAGAADRLHRALREAGITVRRDTLVAGYPVDLTVTVGVRDLALVVDDPAGDPDGRVLRKILARLDIIAGAAEVRRVPAWRCLAEPEQIVTELHADQRA